MRKRFYSAFALITALLIFPSIDLSWSGKVLGVLDDDTITVMKKGRDERVRLYGIECPEKGRVKGERGTLFNNLIDNILGLE